MLINSQEPLKPTANAAPRGVMATARGTTAPAPASTSTASAGNKNNANESTQETMGRRPVAEQANWPIVPFVV